MRTVNSSPKSHRDSSLSLPDLLFSTQDFGEERIALLLKIIQESESDLILLGQLADAIKAQCPTTNMSGLALIAKYACYLLPKIIALAESDRLLRESIIQALLLADNAQHTGFYYLAKYAITLLPKVQNLVAHDAKLKEMFVQALASGPSSHETAFAVIVKNHPHYLNKLIIFVTPASWVDSFYHQAPVDGASIIHIFARQAPAQFVELISSIIKLSDQILIKRLKDALLIRARNRFCALSILIQDQPDYFNRLLSIVSEDASKSTDFLTMFLCLLSDVSDLQCLVKVAPESIDPMLKLLNGYESELAKIFFLDNALFCVCRLYSIARYAPKQFSSLISLVRDDLLAKDRLIAMLISARLQCEWTLLHVIAQYAPAQISLVFSIFNNANGRQQDRFVEAVTSKETINDETVLHMVAQYAPSQLPLCVDILKDIVGEVEIPGLLSQATKNDWTVLEIFSRFASEEDRLLLQSKLGVEAQSIVDKPPKTMTLLPFRDGIKNISQSSLVPILIDVIVTLSDHTITAQKKNNVRQGLCFGFAIVHAFMSTVMKANWWESIFESLAKLPRRLNPRQFIDAPSGGKIGELYMACDELLARVVNDLFFHHAVPAITDIQEHDQFSILKPGGLFDSSLGGIKFYECFSGYFDERRLTALLLVIKPALPLMVIVSGQNHACSISYSDNRWYFYDPNCPEGRILFLSRFELAREILREPNCHFLGSNIFIQVAGFESADNNPKLQEISAHASEFYADPDLYLRGAGLSQIVKVVPEKVSSFMIRIVNDPGRHQQLAVVLNHELFWSNTLLRIVSHTPDILNTLIALVHTNNRLRAAFAQGLSQVTPNIRRSTMLAAIVGVHVSRSVSLDPLLDLVGESLCVRTGFSNALGIADKDGVTAFHNIVFQAEVQILVRLLALSGNYSVVHDGVLRALSCKDKEGFNPVYLLLRRINTPRSQSPLDDGGIIDLKRALARLILILYSAGVSVLKDVMLLSERLHYNSQDYRADNVFECLMRCPKPFFIAQEVVDINAARTILTPVRNVSGFFTASCPSSGNTEDPAKLGKGFQ